MFESFPQCENLQLCPCVQSLSLAYMRPSSITLLCKEHHKPRSSYDAADMGIWQPYEYLVCLILQLYLETGPKGNIPIHYSLIIPTVVAPKDPKQASGPHESSTVEINYMKPLPALKEMQSSV